MKKSPVDFILLGLAILCFSVGGAVYVFGQPFSIEDAPVIEQVAEDVEEEKNETVTLSNVVIEGQQTSEKKNYDTEYGNKEYDADIASVVQKWTDTVFDLGYRQVASGYGPYSENVLRNAPALQVEFGAYHFKEGQFPEFLANAIVTHAAQMEADFVPYAQFEQDNVVYLNGTLKIKFHSGDDMKDLASFLQEKDIELNKLYEIPVCFGYSSSTKEIISFAYNQSRILL